MFKQITSESELIQIISKFPDYHISQSALYFKIRSNIKIPSKTFYFEKDDHTFALATVLEKYYFKKFKYLIIPFAPLMTESFQTHDLNEFLKQIQNEYKDESIININLSPFSNDSVINNKYVELIKESNMLQKSFFDFRHADGTIFVNLEKDLETIKSFFRKDVRYNLKSFENNSAIQVRTTTNEKDFEIFWDSYLNSQKEKGFLDNYNDLYKQLFITGNALIFEALETGKVISSVFCVKFSEQNSLITMLSVSSRESQKLKAPTLLRWEIIKWAKQNGFNKLDLFSASKNEDGPTKFKLGFSKDVIWFNQSYDLVLNDFKYRLIKVLYNIKTNFH